jgi:Spy/CpxP family protein refolding chaperone
MNSKGFKFVVAVATFAALMGFSVLNAQGPQTAQGAPSFGSHHPPMEKAMGPKGDHGRWWDEPTLITKLNLTEDQRKQMDAVLDQHKPELIDQKAKVEKLEAEMEPLMRADKPDEGKILAQIDRIADSRKELEKSNARFLLALRSKLTVDQWKQLEAMRAAHHEHGEEGHHARPGAGGPGGFGGHGAPGAGAPPPPPPPQAGAGPGGPMGGPQFDAPDGDDDVVTPDEGPDGGLVQPISDINVTNVLNLFNVEKSI